MMKNSLTILLGVLLLNSTNTNAEQKGSMSSKSLYQQGLVALKANDFDTAKASFESALRKDPNHGDARFMLYEVKQNEKSIRAKFKKSEFSSIMLKDFNVDGANLSESLELLQKKVEDSSEGKMVPNFIVKDPEKKLADKEISLKLKGIPAGVVLNYVCETIGAKAAHGNFGITISPL